MTTNEPEQSSTGRGESVAGVDLYWLPLGAGGHFVRLNGRVFEAVVSRLEHRPACDLYHSALQVRVPEGRFVIEQTPVPRGDGARRGVAAGGAVGARWAGRFRIFRYEVRRWRDGVIPDVGEAVDSPRRLTDDPDCAGRLLDLVSSLPTPVWGRDELAAGEMWNSNSVISWLIVSSGLNPDSIEPPKGGRAPGWNAGLVVARRLAAQRNRIPLDRELLDIARVGFSVLPPRELRMTSSAPRRSVGFRYQGGSDDDRGSNKPRRPAGGASDHRLTVRG